MGEIGNSLYRIKYRQSLLRFYSGRDNRGAIIPKSLNVAWNPVSAILTWVISPTLLAGVLFISNPIPISP